MGNVNVNVNPGVRLYPQLLVLILIWDADPTLQHFLQASCPTQ